MINILNIENELNKNATLNKTLRLLVDYCIENQTLIFKSSDVRFDIEILLSENILTDKTNKYGISDNWYFSFVFLHKYFTKLDFNIGENFHLTAGFLERIKDIFKEDRFNQGYYNIEKKLWIISILETHKQNGSNFSNYLNSLNIEENFDEIFSFNEAYSAALPYLEIEVSAFYKNIQLFFEWTKSDAYNNMPLWNLMKGIRNKTNRDDKFGIVLFDYSISKPDVETNFLIPIITGLYDKLGEDFYNSRVLPIIDDESYSVAIICGLSNKETINEKEVNQFLQLYKTFNKDTPEILLNIPKLLFAILKSNPEKLKPEFVKDCFKNLTDKGLITNNTKQYKENHSIFA